jgi:hypothetical protein
MNTSNPNQTRIVFTIGTLTPDSLSRGAFPEFFPASLP